MKRGLALVESACLADPFHGHCVPDLLMGPNAQPLQGLGMQKCPVR
jgi:hypothetical protein